MPSTRKKQLSGKKKAAAPKSEGEGCIRSRPGVRRKKPQMPFIGGRRGGKSRGKKGRQS